jgi:hypothetical protein
MMEFLREKPMVVVAVAVIAVGVAGWSVWRVFAPPPSNPRASQVGTLHPMSSMFGPGEPGKPRTSPRPGMMPAGARLPATTGTAPQ